MNCASHKQFWPTLWVAVLRRKTSLASGFKPATFRLAASCLLVVVPCWNFVLVLDNLGPQNALERNSTVSVYHFLYHHLVVSPFLSRFLLFKAGPTINLSIIKNEKLLGTTRNKPGAAGWEGLMLPLCNAAPFSSHPLLIVSLTRRNFSSSHIFPIKFSSDGLKWSNQGTRQMFRSTTAIKAWT